MGFFDSFLDSFGWLHFWLVLGVVLGTIEALTASFFILPFSLGAFITALFSFLGLSVNAQLFIFAISSLIMMFVIQTVVKKYFTSDEGQSLKTNADALAGKKAVVVEPIEGSLRRGAVKIGGETWSAVADGEQRFEREDVVVIRSVSGATLAVGREEAEKTRENGETTPVSHDSE